MKITNEVLQFALEQIHNKGLHTIHEEQEPPIFNACKILLAKNLIELQDRKTYSNVLPIKGLTPLGAQFLSEGGFTEYDRQMKAKSENELVKTKINDRQLRILKYESFPKKYWWLVAILMAILGGFITYIYNKI